MRSANGCDHPGALPRSPRVEALSLQSDAPTFTILLNSRSMRREGAGKPVQTFAALAPTMPIEVLGLLDGVALPQSW
jgi:hypothetical protein